MAEVISIADFVTNFDSIANLTSSDEYMKHGFAIDMSCNGFESIFDQQQHKLLFTSNKLWLLLQNSNEFHIQTDDDSNVIERLNMLPNSEVALSRFDSQESKWTLYDVYKVGATRQLEMHVLRWINERSNDGNCTVRSVLELNEEFHRTKIRRNFKGIHLRCGSSVREPVPLTYLDEMNLDPMDIVAKSTVAVSQLLQEDLNFTCDVVPVSNYGRNDHQALNSKALYRENRIELFAHADIMRPELLQNAEFTVDIYATSTPIIFRQPPLSAVSNIFILPLDKSVWYCYVALILCVIFIMGIQMGHPLLEAQITLFDVVTFVFGAVCQQGTNLFISSLSGRFVLITTFVATLALFTSYSASIVALLQSPRESIHTVDDLLASSLTLGVKDTDYMRRIILNENQTVVRSLYVAKIEPLGTNAWINNEYTGINNVRTNLFAFLVDAPSAYQAIVRTYMEFEKCRLSEINVLLPPMNAITVARNSGYKEWMKQRMVWMREIGLLSRAKAKWLPKRPKCEGDARDFTNIGLSEICPLIYYYLCGVAVSVFILCAELGLARLSLSSINEIII